MGIFYLAPNQTIAGGLLVDPWKSKFHIADPIITLNVKTVLQIIYQPPKIFPFFCYKMVFTT